MKYVTNFHGRECEPGNQWDCADSVTFTFLLPLQWLFFLKAGWEQVSATSTIDSYGLRRDTPTEAFAVGRMYEAVIQRPSHGLQTISSLVQNFRTKGYLVGDLDHFLQQTSPARGPAALCPPGSTFETQPLHPRPTEPGLGFSQEPQGITGTGVWRRGTPFLD